VCFARISPDDPRRRIFVPDVPRSTPMKLMATSLSEC
jgi:hypothetical protein